MPTELTKEEQHKEAIARFLQASKPEGVIAISAKFTNNVDPEVRSYFQRAVAEAKAAIAERDA